MWRWNISQLLRRWDAFNGQKVVSVVTDNNSVAFDEVKKMFPSNGVTFFNFPNDNMLGEVVSFETLMNCVENIDHRQVTFYAHAKGVKYTREQLRSNMVRQWTRVMYSAMLDYPKLIESSLRTKAMVGAFVRKGLGFGVLPPSWHFAGTFFWFRNDAIFGNDDWTHIPRAWWGAEAWPGIVCPHHELMDHLILEGSTPTMRMYTKKYWLETIDDLWREFQIKHAKAKLPRSYSEVLSYLRASGVSRVFVTGPQRSGTMIASKMLSHDMGLPMIEERAFGTHDFQRFNDLALQSGKYVMQCPTMAPYVHLHPDAHVVWMHRDLGDILVSQRRIGWGEFERIEKDRYFSDDNQGSAEGKLQSWERFQRVQLGDRGIDLQYDSMLGHPMWISEDKRINFADRQTTTVYPCNRPNDQ